MGRRELVRRRRLRLAAGALIAFVLGLVLGASGGGDEPRPTAGGPAQSASPAASDPDPEATAEPELPVDRLSLAQQVGRMVILRFAGTSAPGYVRRVLREKRAAGAILFGDNIVDPDQLRRLTRRLEQAGGDLRPIVCVDQEGGVIRNLTWTGPELSAPEQAAAGVVREAAASAGADLRAAGINLNLAPVADVASVPGAALAGRAFSTDYATAAAAVRDSVEGWREAGVATTVKHFPGLGGATVNTDDGPATVDRSRAQLDDDLIPFQAAIEADVPYVMASHATYPALDDARIASQSPAIMTGLLRDELGFEGVLMTDSLEAAAVLAVSDVEESALASARAGVDVILTTGRGSYIRVFRALLAEAQADPDFRARVRESAARVLAAQSSDDG
jgi:beta-N-acetylhexosaminidase